MKKVKVVIVKSVNALKINDRMTSLDWYWSHGMYSVQRRLYLPGLTLNIEKKTCAKESYVNDDECI